MSIKRVDNFKFLGFHLTHKSKVIPRAFIEHYDHSLQPTNTKGRFIYKIQKLIGKIFNNYDIETNKQWRYRTQIGEEADIINSIKEGRSKNLFFTKEEFEKFKNLPYLDEIIPFLRKLEKEGRFKKPINE